MRSLYGKPIAAEILRQTKKSLQARGVTPGLGVVLVGNDPASEIYVELKEKAARSVGVAFEKHLLPADSRTDDVRSLVQKLNTRADIHGIIVQLPLPAGIEADAVIATICPHKDADGFHPETVERFLAGSTHIPPVFPRAILALLRNTGVTLQDKQALIFANSHLFARVMAKALSQFSIRAEDSLLLTPAETKTKLASADIIISAKGDPHFLKGDMVRSGAIIVDGGITRVGERVMSDVDPASFELIEGFITPVPGGVGPVTVAYLIARVAELALGGSDEESILES